MYNYPLATLFEKISEVKKTKYIFILILVTVITSLIETHFTIEKTPIANINGTDQMKPLIIIYTILLLTSFFKILFIILAHFTFFYISASVFRIETKKRHILKATTLLITFTYTVQAIILIIQYITNLSPLDYNIGSLNIFDSGNTLLESLNLVLVIKTYLMILILKYTIALKNKPIVILIIIYLLITIGFQVFRYLL